MKMENSAISLSEAYNKSRTNLIDYFFNYSLFPMMGHLFEIAILRKNSIVPGANLANYRQHIFFLKTQSVLPILHTLTNGLYFQNRNSLSTCGNRNSLCEAPLS